MYGKDRDGIGRPVLVNSEGMPIMQSNLADAAKEGRLFSVANQTGVTTTAALATTWTGLGVGNPTGSGKLYVFHEFGWSQAAVMNTDGPIGLMIATVGDMAQALTPRCARTGYKTSNALCDSAATPGTPVLERVCGTTLTGAISTTGALPGNTVDLKGGIVIPAGYALLSYTLEIQTSSIQFHFVWEEIDA